MDGNRMNGGRRERTLAKSRGEPVRCPPGRMLAPPTYPIAKAPPPPPVAAIAAELNVRLRSADMPAAMQGRAFRCIRALLDTKLEKRPSPTYVAMCLKKEFDAVYGVAWHCVVGKSFGSFVTHSSGGFVYFSVDNLCFLLFRTELKPLLMRR